MPKSPVLDPNDRLAQIGSEWFADVRRRNPDEPVDTKRKNRFSAIGDSDSPILDWLFGDGDCDCDAGGDSGSD